MALFSPPPSTQHGCGEIADIDSIAALERADSIAVVTDAGVSNAGLLDPVMDALDVSTVYDGVEPNPSVETVREIRDVSEAADAIVGIGGGSVMDATKAGCALPAFETFDRLRAASMDTQPAGDGVPCVLVPTTAGTGTETGHWAVISDHDAQEKRSVGHPSLAAAATVLDPELTTSLPPSLTAATGFDVVTHAIEAAVSTGATSLTDPYAMRAFETAVAHLPHAVRDGDDLVARERMLEGSYLAGLSMNNAGLGAVHAISHAVGGLYDTPHGHTNALLLPHVVKANADASERARRRYGQLVGGARNPGRELAGRIETLLDVVGLDESLPDAPATWDWAAIADRALANVNMETNPAAFDEETIVSICRAALTDH